MSDFNSEFWNWFIILPTLLGIVWCFWLVWWMSGSSADDTRPESEAEDTGHVWDVDLKEYNNPLPRWWLGLFYITLVFSIVYLLLYPGLGSFGGFLGWSSKKAYEDEMALADEKYGPLFQKYLSQDLVTVSSDPQAGKIGERLFLNYCSTCHGSDARGARGFPNLRDNDWLWGGDAESIKLSILHGRNGMMPGWGAALGGADGVSSMTDYVLSLSGRDHDAEAAARGQAQFAVFCAACHGAEGRGNPGIGAPNLTDNIWLHGSSRTSVSETIDKGRQSMMPGHAEFLGEAKVHLIAAYIYGLPKDK